MSNDSYPKLPPLPSSYRASGLLLHVTSLPSPYGIGDVGRTATAWIDQLYEAGQSWWQALPLGPTGYGLAWSSPTALAIAPVQDVLNLGAEGSNEHPRSAGRQLELAQHRRVVVSCWFSCAAGPDNKLKPPPHASESGD